MTVVPSSMVNSIEDRTKLHTAWALDTLNSELYSLLWNARTTARFASYLAVEHRPTSLVIMGCRGHRERSVQVRCSFRVVRESRGATSHVDAKDSRWCFKGELQERHRQTRTISRKLYQRGSVADERLNNEIAAQRFRS